MWQFFVLNVLVFSFLFNFIQCETLGFFWHISDTHVDQNYSRTGNLENMCHEDGNSSTDNGIFGNFYCDSPQYLVTMTLQSMKTINPNPDFIIWTGDNLPHTRVPPFGWDVTYEAIKNTSLLMASLFPNISIFPCIGNHDTVPPNRITGDNMSQSIYKSYLENGAWNKILKEDTWSTFLQGGYYSSLVNSSLRIVSLNTILWYEPNNLTQFEADPGNQFEWLENVLANSTKLHEKVYLIGHVPPGFYNRITPGEQSNLTYHPQHAERFMQILLKFNSVIAGQLYGHHHMDTFQVFQYNTGTFMGSSLIASSVTPWHPPGPATVNLPVNPSVRLVHYSKGDATLIDFDQYFLDLNKANADPGKGMYQHLYSFCNLYGVADLTTPSLVIVYEDLKAYPSVYDRFYDSLTSGKKPPECDQECKVAQLCAMSSISTNEYGSCMASSTPTKPHSRLVLYLVLGFGSVVAIVGGVAFWVKRRRSRLTYQTLGSL